jgi:hypothetical protein
VSSENDSPGTARVVHEYDPDRKILSIRFLSAGEPDRERVTGTWRSPQVYYDSDWYPALVKVPLEREDKMWPVKLLIGQIDRERSHHELNPHLNAPPCRSLTAEDRAALLEAIPDRMSSPYMTMTSPVPEGAVCEKCEKHPAADMIYAPGGVMEANHGHFVVWCECCIMRDCLEKAEAAASRLPGLRERLAGACP